MKKFSIKVLCSAMAWTMAISPILACTAAPKADVSKPVPSQNSSTYCECMISSAEKAPQKVTPESNRKCPSNKPSAKPEVKPTPAPCKPSETVKPEVKPTPVPCKPGEAVKPETKPTPAPCKPCKPGETVKPETKPTPAPTKPSTGNESTQNTFVIDNFKVIQSALQKLGVQPEELEVMIKEGKKLPEVLELKNIPVPKFKKVLLKQYYVAINEGVENKQITKEEAKMLRSAIKEKVMSWLQTK